MTFAALIASNLISSIPLSRIQWTSHGATVAFFVASSSAANMVAPFSKPAQNTGRYTDRPGRRHRG